MFVHAMKAHVLVVVQLHSFSNSGLDEVGDSYTFRRLYLWRRKLAPN
jgi:hypothetical protein